MIRAVIQPQIISVHKYFYRSKSDAKSCVIDNDNDIESPVYIHRTVRCIEYTVSIELFMHRSDRNSFVLLSIQLELDH